MSNSGRFLVSPGVYCAGERLRSHSQIQAVVWRRYQIYKCSCLLCSHPIHSSLPFKDNQEPSTWPFSTVLFLPASAHSRRSPSCSRHRLVRRFFAFVMCLNSQLFCGNIAAQVASGNYLVKNVASGLLLNIQGAAAGPGSTLSILKSSHVR